MDFEELRYHFEIVLTEKLKFLAKEYGFRSGKLALKKKSLDKSVESQMNAIWTV